MITEIGIVAGDIWHLLDKHGQMQIKEIIANLPERNESLVFMSLGWLGREGHVGIDCKGVNSKEYSVTLRK